MIMKDKKITPGYVDTLSSCEIFVFGSNLEGQHLGGAARTAYEKFGAEWGVGDGPTGRSYAIPTMFANSNEIRPYVQKFIEYAKEHPMNRFLLTRVGCGIAGFSDADMGYIFRDIIDIPNITYPEEWIQFLYFDVTVGLKSLKEPERTPLVISDEILKELCQKHLYEIGAGVLNLLPQIKVRYAIDNDKFGYTCFGNFFYFGDDFYVWDKNDIWAEDHNQDVVETIFEDECLGRGYAHRVIFAGVETNFKDINGENIYTGDVINIQKADNYSDNFAVGADADKEGNGQYCFFLDNHLLSLTECNKRHYKMTRVGTVFFKLDKNDRSQPINKLAILFNGWHDTSEERELKLLMAQFTPNFEQEDWKYKGLKILGVEYNWR